MPVSRLVLPVCVVATVAAIGCVPLPAAHAQKPIIDFFDARATGIGNGGSFTIGFDFTVTGTQTITGLGYFDLGANGLAASHTVGLFDSSGTLLTSLVVTNANSSVVASENTSGTAAGNYRRVDFSSAQVLTSGTYILGGTYFSGDGDNVASMGSAINTPGFTLGNARFVGGTGLNFPTDSFPSLNAGIFGPMAFTNVAPATGAPEPSTLPLMGMGLSISAAMAGTIRRRKANHAHRDLA